MKFSRMIESFLVLTFAASIVFGQVDPDPVVVEIQETLTRQQTTWNSDDLEGFMATYWKSPELTFSSGGKTTRGWQQTLDNYRANYPGGSMGQLTIDHLETTVLGAEAALVLGQWHLQMPDKNRDGNFSLVLRKLEGKWKIVHDHSSLLEPEPEPGTEKE